MKIARMAVMVMVVVLGVNSLAMAVVVYFDDGFTHSISDDTYKDDEVYLDYYADKGTHLDVKQYAYVLGIRAYKNSTVTTARDGSIKTNLTAFDSATITMNGGMVSMYLWAHDNSTITMNNGSLNKDVFAVDYSTFNMSGGEVKGAFRVNNNSTVTISGGDVWGDIYAYDNSSVTVSGGEVGGTLYSHTNSTIYLNGDNFSINGNSIAYGQYSASDFSSGYLTGTLLYGGIIANNFEISGSGTIVLVPEPTSLLLFALGGLALRRRRS